MKKNLSFALVIGTLFGIAMPCPVLAGSFYANNAAVSVRSVLLRAQPELGPVELEISSGRLKFDGGYFSVAVSTTHHSGDKLNFLSSVQDATNYRTDLVVLVKGADAVNSRNIVLLNEAGMAIPAYTSTCQYAGICLLDIRVSEQFEYGVYQAHPDANHVWTIRVYYNDGTSRDSRLVIDRAMSL